MKRIISLILALIFCTLSFSSFQAFAEVGDSIKILSISPNYFVRYGYQVIFSVDIEYNLASSDQGIVYLGFNNGEENRFYLVDDNVIVNKGYGTCTLVGTVSPVNWADDGLKGIIDKLDKWLTGNSPNFSAYVNISEYPHPDSWDPLASDQMALDYVPTAQADPSVYTQYPPIIIIPGIMGSKLFEKSNDKNIEDKMIWPPISHPFSLDRMAINVDLSVPDYKQNQQTLPAEKREYGSLNTYKVMINKLCEEFPQRAVYYFSYDFRQSNQNSGALLEQFVNALGVPKVDLVCHSMGGLVASHFIARSDENKNKVRKIITLGTPYEGAPLLMHTAATGDFHLLDKLPSLNACINGFAALSGLSKSVITGLPGAAELTPTQRYTRTNPNKIIDGSLQNDFIPIITESKINDASDNDNYDYCCRLFSQIPYSDVSVDSISYSNDKQGDSPASAHSVLQSQNRIVDSDGINVLGKLNNAYFFIGNGKRTVNSVVYSKDKNFISFIRFTNSGDGTVPLQSANMLGGLSGNVKYFNIDHGGLASEEESLNELIKILREDTNIQYENTNPSDIAGVPYTILIVACPTDVTVGSGQSILTNEGKKFNATADFGEMYILGENNEIKLFAMDTGDYDVSIIGTGTGEMDFALQYYDANDNLLDTRTVENVAITPKTRITTSTNMKDKTVLSVDENSDGTTDKTIDLKVEKKLHSGKDTLLIIVGIIIALMIVVVGVILIIKFKSKVKANKKEKAGGDDYQW